MDILILIVQIISLYAILHSIRGVQGAIHTKERSTEPQTSSQEQFKILQRKEIQPQEKKTLEELDKEIELAL